MVLLLDRKRIFLEELQLVLLLLTAKLDTTGESLPKLMREVLVDVLVGVNIWLIGMCWGY